ncbi:PAS domain-containing protein tyrosine kinase family protein [Citrus sinensis]|uniref:PAS domain-containing protein tyrosine kinase family protein n=1 Tax=Citrus sinensis TaxID=2711 RepID=A0ACB8LW84_CITSI|nr:PAS domain-containing protein tyrosine kinase family protein [Citrus sinensis]
MAGDESGPSLYRDLLDRFEGLEAGHAKLREELNDLLLQEKKKNDDVDEVATTSDSDAAWSSTLPGCFNEVGPYRSVLESMGHAVHFVGEWKCAHRVLIGSMKLHEWCLNINLSASRNFCICPSNCNAELAMDVIGNRRNRSAESLYGWKDREVFGQRVTEFLIAEEFHSPHKKIMERLASGQSWSGQFPFKKRSGEILMAVVTKSPLYEDGELAGFITVSSDAAIFNSINPQHPRPYPNRGQMHGLNLKKIQWQPHQPQIAQVPNIASSVTNLASKFLLRRRGDDMSNASESSRSKKDATDTEDFKLEKSGTMEEKLNSNFHNEESTAAGRSFRKDESAFEIAQPSKITAKVLEKMHIGETGTYVGGDDGSLRQNGLRYKSFCNEITNKPNSSRFPDQHTSSSEDKAKCVGKINSSFAAENANANICQHRLPNASEEIFCDLAFSRECNDRGTSTGHRELLPGHDVNELDPDGKQYPSLGESSRSRESSSSKGDNETSCATDGGIRWEDLQLGEEIGLGSYAVVYRGIWNGSDVAVKVYFGSEYIEGTLKNYQKEIDIIKKLRHPNVLLFMGAVASQERLGIVTEFLPRGSLFKTLHKNYQALDIKRRLRMALDVARGMNYLHHRNPPIVHRDLKSSNLLVDKNWTVKVGDFGLSSLKNATYLTAKSGRGTPQWMAPEVLRSEPSNEKSDVFSFGVILWELVTASIPWNNLNLMQVVGVVGFMDRRLELPEGLDPRLESIIHDCWQSDPDQRPSFQVIIQRMSGLLRRDGAATVEKNSEC